MKPLANPTLTLTSPGANPGSEAKESQCGH